MTPSSNPTTLQRGTGAPPDAVAITPRLTTDAAVTSALSGLDDKLYAALTLVSAVEADPGLAAALAAATPEGAGAPALLVSLRAVSEEPPLPELPLALLDPAGGRAPQRFGPYALPPRRADRPLELAVLVRAARRPMQDAQAAAEQAATQGGLAAGPTRWLAAPLSTPAAAIAQGAADQALAAAFGPPARLGAPVSPSMTAPSRLALGDDAASGVTLSLTPQIARSRIEAAQTPEALAKALTRADPALGLRAGLGAQVLETAFYAGAPGPVSLGRALGQEGGAADRAFTALSDPTAPSPPGLTAERCLILDEFLRARSGLTPLDQAAARVEALRAGGRIAAAFSGDACLRAAERRAICAAGLLPCGATAPDVEPAAAFKALADFMRRPTPDRRRALAALLPDRLTVSEPDLLRSGATAAGPRRRRFDREAALDWLAGAQLNRYGGAAQNPDDPDWWVMNFTRRPALRQVVTVYAAFEEGLFADLGFDAVSVSAADLADPRGWARAHLGPLTVPCNATERPTTPGAPLQARRALSDCAAFADFAVEADLSADAAVAAPG